MKFPSNLNCDGKIVSEMGPRVTMWSYSQCGISLQFVPRVQLTNIQHWCSWWLVDEQVTSPLAASQFLQITIYFFTWFAARISDDQSRVTLIQWSGCPLGNKFFMMLSRSQAHHLNPSWPCDAIWWHSSGSLLAQVMACCLITPSH